MKKLKYLLTVNSLSVIAAAVGTILFTIEFISNFLKYFSKNP